MESRRRSVPVLCVELQEYDRASRCPLPRGSLYQRGSDTVIAPCTRCAPATAPPHLASPAPWQRRDSTVPQFELSVWRKPEEWRQGIKEGSVMRLLMVGAGGLVAGRMRLTASNSTGYMPCLNVPTPPNVVPRTRHLVNNIRTGGVDASGASRRVDGVGCPLVCLCAFVVCTGVDVVGTVVHVTPLRSTTTRGGRASSVFNVFMTDESGELLDVMVVGARPSLRAQFPQGRAMGLLDLRFTNYHERYGVTRCIFGDKSGVITQSQRQHVSAGLGSLARWLSTPAGRVRVVVRGRACRVVSVIRLTVPLPHPHTVRPARPAETSRKASPAAKCQTSHSRPCTLACMPLPLLLHRSPTGVLLAVARWLCSKAPWWPANGR